VYGENRREEGDINRFLRGYSRQTSGAVQEGQSIHPSFAQTRCNVKGAAIVMMKMKGGGENVFKNDKLQQSMKGIVTRVPWIEKGFSHRSVWEKNKTFRGEKANHRKNHPTVLLRPRYSVELRWEKGPIDSKR